MDDKTLIQKFLHYIRAITEGIICSVIYIGTVYLGLYIFTRIILFFN